MMQVRVVYATTKFNQSSEVSKECDARADSLRVRKFSLNFDNMYNIKNSSFKMTNEKALKS